MSSLTSQVDTADQRNYPYNCWWVAALSAEVGRSLLARWLLDTPVVLYRKEDGSVVALEDRCPHRQAPLSIGKLCGDIVQCGYHGMQFSPDGRCIKVPSQDAPPPISVGAYPVIEIGPLVWIYLGDISVIDQVPPPPELPWLTDENFAVRTDKLDVAANYMLLRENVLDLTHFGYVHPTTFQITDWSNPPEVTVDGEVVRYKQSFVNSPLPPGYAIPLGLKPGISWNRESFGAMLSPAIGFGATDFYDPAKPGAAPVGRFRVAHVTTPVDQNHMLYFYVIARDHGHEPEQMDQLAAAIKKGFHEDEFILEAIQQQMDRKPRRGSQGERSVKADVSGIQARRIVGRWMAREMT